jgi:hypothetical protein
LRQRRDAFLPTNSLQWRVGLPLMFGAKSKSAHVELHRSPGALRTVTKTTNYRLGALYAIWTAALLAAQEPFSVLAARRLSSPGFLGLTQIALLISIPLLLVSDRVRRDFIALITDSKQFGRMLILFAIGLAGLFLYNLGLGSAHPIIVAVILNLSPFWAALVARIVSRKSLPVSAPFFLACFALAFIGAMTIAWSQMEPSTKDLLQEIVANFWRRTWMFAIPVPILFALSGTLIADWFSDYNDVAAVSANFLISATILTPACLATSYSHLRDTLNEQTLVAILLLILGTVVGAVGGRVYYQMALTKTGNDNGFVTMFFLLAPGLTTFISLPLSHWIPELHFALNALFFSGLAMITLALFLFSFRTLRAQSSSPVKIAKFAEVPTGGQA